MDLKIEFTDKAITPWGGISLMHQMMEKLSIKQLIKNITLPDQGYNREGMHLNSFCCIFGLAFGVVPAVLSIWKLHVKKRL